MHITHCPTCSTAFKVTPDQLKLANGWVRCGRCNAVFEAHLHFSPAAQEPVQIEPVFERAAEPAVAPSFTEPPAGASASASANPFESTSAPTPEPEATGTAETVPASHRLNLMWLVLSALLALALVWQWLIWQRHWLAAQEPALKPVLEALCAPWGCEVGWPREPDAVLIESSSFNEDPEGGFILQLRMKNTQHHAVATPALELNLTDMQDQVVVRRVFSPQELAVRDNIPALRDVRATLNFELDDATAERIVGFRAFIFYP